MVNQRCFDDNNDDDKGDDKKLKDQSMNNSRVQESRRIQDSRRKPRIKNQDSRFKISRIKIMIQDSSMKKILNQDKY